MSRLILAVLAVVVSSVSFAQVPVPAPSAPQSQCDQKLWFADNGTVKEACVGVGGRANVRPLLYMPQGVQQIVPLDADQFLAYSQSGKVTKFNTSNFSRIDSRIYGGGVIISVNAVANSVEYRLPYEGEQYSGHLFPGGASSLRNWLDPRTANKAACSTEILLKLYNRDMCFTPSLGAMMVPYWDAFGGSDYSRGQLHFQGAGLVNVVAVGENVVATVGTKYDCPPTDQPGTVGPCTKTLGKLVLLHFPMNGHYTMETLRPGLDILSDPMQQHLAVSDRGMYYVTVNFDQYGPHYAVNYLGFNNRASTVLYQSNTLITGLALVPKPAQSNVMAQPAP